jgi:hypothetical protein
MGYGDYNYIKSTLEFNFDKVNDDTILVGFNAQYTTSGNNNVSPVEKIKYSDINYVISKMNNIPISNNGITFNNIYKQNNEIKDIYIYGILYDDITSDLLLYGIINAILQYQDDIVDGNEKTLSNTSFILFKLKEGGTYSNVNSITDVQFLLLKSQKYIFSINTILIDVPTSGIFRQLSYTSDINDDLKYLVIDVNAPDDNPLISGGTEFLNLGDADIYTEDPLDIGILNTNRDAAGVDLSYLNVRPENINVFSIGQQVTIAYRNVDGVNKKAVTIIDDIDIDDIDDGLSRIKCDGLTITTDILNIKINLDNTMYLKESGAGYLLSKNSTVCDVQYINNYYQIGDSNINDAGGIIGSGVGTKSKEMYLTFCNNFGYINGTGSGGICGSNVGQESAGLNITNCDNFGYINGSESGGICGSNAGLESSGLTISDCNNSGDIYGTGSGGICGSNAGLESSGLTISDCNNSADLYRTGSGGICGSNAGLESSGLTISDCNNSGDIYGTGSGGICGQSIGDKSVLTTIKTCMNEGVIYGENSGGICGSNTGQESTRLIISNCENNGDIEGDNSGGICGQNTGQDSVILTIYACKNNKMISGQYSGGICGSNTGTGINTRQLSIKDCENNGFIVGTGSGGICGSVDGNGSFEINNCKNKGAVVGEKSGGICGENTTTTTTLTINASFYKLIRCNNDSGVVLGESSGGICGYNFSKNAFTFIYECHNNTIIVDASNEVGIIYGDGAGGICGANPNNINIDLIVKALTFDTQENTDKSTKILTFLNEINNTYDIEIKGSFSIVNSTNNSDIYGYLSGGIAGALENNSSVCAMKCINYGKIGDLKINSLTKEYIKQILNAVQPLVNITNRLDAPTAESLKLGCGGIIGGHTASSSTASYVYKCNNYGSIGIKYNAVSTDNTTGISTIKTIVSSECGGIVGHKFSYGSDENNISIVEECENKGDINADLSGGISGGLEGYDNGHCNILNCKNYGKIKGMGSGGITGTGTAKRGGIVLISKCINYGDIDINTNSEQSQDGIGHSGGIVGSYCVDVEHITYGRCNIEYCENNGAILNNYSGGITGSNTGNYILELLLIETILNFSDKGCNIKHCINNGLIKSDYSGGICGAFAGSNGGVCVIEKCINNSSIDGDNSGGICGLHIGYSYNGTVNNEAVTPPSRPLMLIFYCINNGDINGSKCGGICGPNAAYNTNYTTYEISNYYGYEISNCINNGRIIGQECAGIVGSFNESILDLTVLTTENVNAINGSLSVLNCINEGYIEGESSSGIIGSNAITYLSNTLISNNINNGNILNKLCSGIVGSGNTTNPYLGITNKDTLLDRKVLISNCVNTGTIGKSGLNMVSECGGIIGAYFSLGITLQLGAGSNNIETNPDNSIQSVPVIKECINRGNIIDSIGSGGISGPYNDNISIENCVNYGNVYISEAYDNFSIAGIHTANNVAISIKIYLNIDSCVNYGNMYGNNVFGICGNFKETREYNGYTYYNISIKNCINYGNLNNNYTLTNTINGSNVPISAGICGSIDSSYTGTNNAFNFYNTEIIGCYNLGITTRSGIILEIKTQDERIEDITISDCYNIGRTLYLSGTDTQNEIIANTSFDIIDSTNDNKFNLVNCYDTVNRDNTDFFIKHIKNIKSKITENIDGTDVNLLDPEIYVVGYPYPVLKSLQNPNIWSNYNMYDDIPVLINIPLKYQSFIIGRLPYDGELEELIGPKGDTGPQGEKGDKGEDGNDGVPGEDGNDGVNTVSQQLPFIKQLTSPFGIITNERQRRTNFIIK